MKYIQSFYQYPVTFSSIGKTIAARKAVGEMKNIVEISEKELEKLKNSEPFFRELLNKKKIRILDKVPNSYVPPAQQINKAQDEAAQAKAEADRLRKENEAMRAQLAAFANPDPAAEKLRAEMESVANGKAPAGDDEGTTEENTAPAAKTENEIGVTSYEATDYKGLQEVAKSRGINPNQKKTALIEELKKYDAEHVSE